MYTFFVLVEKLNENYLQLHDDGQYLAKCIIYTNF